MITPILAMIVVPPWSLLSLLLLFGVGVSCVIKYKKYSEALLSVAVVGGVISLIWGMVLVEDNDPKGWLVGSIMLTAGLGVVTSIGIALRKQDSTNK